MIAAFLRHENISIPDKVKEAKVFRDLNDKGNTEEICSSFVWRCLKNAAGGVGDEKKYKGASSFILPGTLALRLRHDNNFELKSNDKEDQMIMLAMREISVKWEKQCEKKENKTPSFWQRSKLDLASLQTRYNALREFLYRNMYSIDAQMLLKEGLPLIAAAADADTRKTRAYQFLQAAAEKRGIAFTAQVTHTEKPK